MRIGFRTSLGWAGATRAASATRDGGAVVAELETAVTTPAGTTPADPLRVRITPGGVGMVTCGRASGRAAARRRSASASSRGSRSASSAWASGRRGSTSAAPSGSRPTWPTARTTRTPSAPCSPRSSRRRGTGSATTRPTSRSPGCSRRSATGCSSRTRRRLPRLQPGAASGRLEVTTAPDDFGADQSARRPAAAGLLRRIAGRRPAPLHRPRRPPARAAGAVGLGRVVPARRHARRAARAAREAPQGRRAAVGDADLPALPARAAPTSADRTPSASAWTRSTPAALPSRPTSTR